MMRMCPPAAYLNYRKYRNLENQIFDTVYRTMATKMPALMIPLINEVFGTNYRSSRQKEKGTNIKEREI